jgi:aminocarboxymuconate-semialdehyde decarboxylase
MKIDVHAHIVDQIYLDALIKLMDLTASKTDTGQTLLRRGNVTVAWHREEFFDPDARVRQMDLKGIDIRILSVSSPSVYDWPLSEQTSVARHTNDAIARMCKAHPSRFRGLATLPLGNTAAAIDELHRSIDELGFVGVAIGSNFGGKPMNHPDLEPIWQLINRRRIPVVEHPMLPLGSDHMDEFELPIRVGFIYDTTTALTRMIYSGIFERYPDFPFVIAHTGGALLPLLERLDNGYRLFPDCRKHISRLPSEYARSLYYDTCSFFGPTIMLAHQILGPEKLLWGTDDPFIGAGTEYIERLDLTRNEKDLILGGNAARIFKIT